MMHGYVVTKGGTFGVVKRNYIDSNGDPCVVIQWGKLGWVTPARVSDCKQLKSSYQNEALAEASAWIASLEAAL